MFMKSVVQSESKEIIGYTFEEYREMVRQFHGYEAPGLLIGGFMVALAVQNMPKGVLFDAIAETTGKGMFHVRSDLAAKDSNVADKLLSLLDQDLLIESVTPNREKKLLSAP